MSADSPRRDHGQRSRASFPGRIRSAVGEHILVTCLQTHADVIGRTVLPRSRRGYESPSSLEWDVVAESLDRTKLLTGEVKIRASQRDVQALIHRPVPTFAGCRTVLRALFAAHTRGRLRAPG